MAFSIYLSFIATDTLWLNFSKLFTVFGGCSLAKLINGSSHQIDQVFSKAYLSRHLISDIPNAAKIHQNCWYSLFPCECIVSVVTTLQFS